MKKLAKLVAAVAAVGVLAGAGVASAGGFGEGGGRREKMLQKFDKNSDGKLDDAEKLAMMKAREEKFAAKKKELIGKYDANKDGALDDGERSKAKSERRAAKFKQLDANNDGKLTLTEFQAGGLHGRHGGKR